MQNVKKFRRLAGLSQADLAAKSGVAQHTIANTETGKQQPRPSTLRKLAAALNVEVRDLFGHEEALPKVPGPLHELSEERRRTLLGLLAVKDLPPSPAGAEMKEYAELAREMQFYGFPFVAFRRWFHETNADDVRDELLPEGKGTFEAEAMQLQLEM